MRACLKVGLPPKLCFKTRLCSIKAAQPFSHTQTRHCWLQYFITVYPPCIPIMASVISLFLVLKSPNSIKFQSAARGSRIPKVHRPLLRKLGNPQNPMDFQTYSMLSMLSSENRCDMKLLKKGQTIVRSPNFIDQGGVRMLWWTFKIRNLRDRNYHWFPSSQNRV